MPYSHDLFWTARATSGSLAGLDLCHNYSCFDDTRTRAHIAALLRDVRNVSHVHLIERT